MNDDKYPEPKPCPLCGGDPKLYRVATYGLIRCWPCGLRLESDGGLKAAVTKWNKRSK